ncbi:MAG: hypothetical protein WBU20_04575 [Candidatus Acidiferrum sp.]
MWNRACPICFAKVPHSVVLTRTDEVICPSCRTPLELSRASRVLGAWVGLLAAFAAIRTVPGTDKGINWVLPILAAVIAYGVASALVIYFLADLVVLPKPSASHFPQTHK